MAARARGVDLRERVEHRVELVLGDADAGVARPRSAAAPRRPISPSSSTSSTTRPRSVNLTRVVQQVHEHLAQPHRIAFDPLRQPPRDRAAQGDRLVARRRRHQVDRLVDERAQVEVRRVEGELARLDAREVEHVVDQGQQRRRRPVRRLGVVALLAVERRVEQQLGGAEDAVHRRADLVADRRQELRLGDVGLLGAAARLLEVARLRLERALLLLEARRPARAPCASPGACGCAGARRPGR